MIVAVLSIIHSLLPTANIGLLMDITGVILLLGQICLAILCLLNPTWTAMLKAIFFFEQGMVGLFFASCLISSFKFAF